jgi:hypothetical protein
MSVSQQIKDILDADATLMALLTGGLYTFDETGHLGIGTTSTPAAFDGARLMPCGVVKARAEIATGEIKDQANKVTSTNQVVEIWLYEPDSTETIEEAAERVYNLLHETKPFQGVWCAYLGADNGEESRELAAALFIRQEFQLKGLKGN